MSLGSLFLAAFALTALDQPWAAVPAGLCAVSLAIGTVMGWCPAQLLTPARIPPANTLGYDEARQPIDIHARS